MKKIWIRKAKSFSEAWEQDMDYYLEMSAKERLEIVQFLRDQYPRFAGDYSSESGKGLRRAITVVQQK
jgi:hypothetical protein